MKTQDSIKTNGFDNYLKGHWSLVVRMENISKAPPPFSLLFSFWRKTGFMLPSAGLQWIAPYYTTFTLPELTVHQVFSFYFYDPGVNLIQSRRSGRNSLCSGSCLTIGNEAELLLAGLHRMWPGWAGAKPPLQLQIHTLNVMKAVATENGFVHCHIHVVNL